MIQTGASARDLLNVQVVTETVLPVVVFVVVNGQWGLGWAAATAIGLALGLTVWRLMRGGKRLYALGGLAGAVLAAGTALWSGSAGGYFGPSLVLNGLYAVGVVVSILVRRPFIALSGALLYGWPLAWYFHPRVRPAYSEVSWAWAALFGLRTWVRYRIIAGGELGVSETVLVLVTGWPVFAVLLVGTYAYVNWRLRTLGAPDVETFRS
ncbi:MAG: DUF3159 domain-containing protein [Egibacteraceae bacterium]